MDGRSDYFELAQFILSRTRLLRRFLYEMARADQPLGSRTDYLFRDEGGGADACRASLSGWRRCGVGPQRRDQHTAHGRAVRAVPRAAAKPSQPAVRRPAFAGCVNHTPCAAAGRSPERGVHALIWWTLRRAHGPPVTAVFATLPPLPLAISNPFSVSFFTWF